MENGKAQSFRDLIVWQEAHKLALLVYGITRDFPKEEIYCLVSQLRRAAISITSNLAEGFGRQSLKEKIQFYYIAYGSLVEVENQLIFAKDIGYGRAELYRQADEQIVLVQKLLNSLIKSLKAKDGISN